MNKNWRRKILFFSEWNLLEKGLLLANFIVTFCLLIYQCIVGNVNDWKTWLAFVANIFNIVSVILATKKHISCFIWGLLAVIGFGGVAFGSQATGNVILYWIFYIPAQLFALYLWRKNSNDKIQVKPTTINGWQIVVTMVCTVGFIILFSWIETINKFQSFWYGKNIVAYSTLTYILDAAVLILSIVMTIFTWCRFKERWYISVLVDTCQIALWSAIVYHKGISDISGWIMIISSITMMISAIYGVFNWQK
ncbi:MAG: nicotinamide riboside transporter PnuC [Mycoplasmataceae bacterium]|jgi:nicotinamide mononucleotide transporter PnuC|nr:nicotinamide riboside transporter PnuC [Mycoplasmataceae bacterium]